MKKFIFSLIAMIMMSFSVNAQSHVSSTSLTDNWFVGANVGAVAPLSHSFDWANHGLQTYRPEVGIEVGRWITPVIALGVSGEVQINTTKSKTAFDLGTATADLHVNLSNLFGGYNGTPRNWEFEAIPSVGFVHFYGDVTPTNHRFFALGRVALSANYNFGADKQWVAYVRPAVQYVERVRDTNGQFDLRVGLVYKFSGKSKSHNHVNCNAADLQNELDVLTRKYDALANAPVVTKTVEVVKEVPVEKVVSVDNTFVVNFARGKFNLTDDAKTVLDGVGDNAVVVIDAFASPEGGKSFNQKLSQKRADAVKEYLEARGVRVDSAVGHGSSLASNRIAIVKIKWT